MKKFSIILLCSVAFAACQSNTAGNHADQVIANGQMPDIVNDGAAKFHLVYGTGDSIMYAHSEDNGLSFSTPSLVMALKKLAASHSRGPQVAATSTGLVITACTNEGNIFSFVKEGTADWTEGGRVNDQDTVAKENLMALGADGSTAFAVWLDLRSGHNQIFGARSTDGGKTWSRNQLIYSSPDTTVCQCCKPSVAVKGDHVAVMFRNWLNGNRDLYLIQSADGGLSFGSAQKLGKGSWALNGCPMDGGGLTIAENGAVNTVWNRKGVIYSAQPLMEERELGTG
ncbi:MAG TPA: sialidase family protein, partial [Flavisolibacter sp.]|nr:sialidase family protein [Flavisolibacter sp.]